jgi:hypothetical protein
MILKGVLNDWLIAAEVRCGSGDEPGLGLHGRIHALFTKPRSSDFR